MIKIILFTILIGSVFAQDVVKEGDNQKTEKKSKKITLYQYEKTFNDMIHKVKRMNIELKNVKDQKTAKRVLINIERLSEQLLVLIQKLEEMGPPNPDYMLTIEKKYGPKMQAAVLEFSTIMTDLEKKEYASDILVALSWMKGR